MKYIKPKSLTWWASIAPILAGAVVATEPLHGLASIVTTINNFTGNMSAAVMVNAGLIGIGVRGAIK
jgi:hypothetical protein